MNNFVKKIAAILLLAIYAVNPLHAVLHAGHDHGSHAACSSKDCKPVEQIKIYHEVQNDIHDCHLCINSQDRNYLLPLNTDKQYKYAFPSQADLSFYNTILISKGIFFVDSRGPPSFI